jgi:hypothetical protein
MFQGLSLFCIQCRKSLYTEGRAFEDLEIAPGLTNRIPKLLMYTESQKSRYLSDVTRQNALLQQLKAIRDIK